MQEFPTAKITQPKPGVFVYDLGRNFSGWPRLIVEGPAGAMVKMIPGELLDDKGLVSQKASGGPMWFAYTLKGDRREVWSPRFSYYGFRYVQVEGAVPEGTPDAPAALPRIMDLTGQFVHCSAQTVGSFACANPNVNRIHDLIQAAIKSNFQSVLTDCPHREKLGWLEQSHLLAGAMMFNYDVPVYYAKICDDAAEAQTADGLIPDIAPEYTVFPAGFRDSPEWGSAFVINPWHIYQVYADDSVLAKHYEVIKKYVAYLGSKSKEHIVLHGLGDWADYGPNPPGVSQLTSLGLTATAIYYQDLTILEQMARLLDKPAEAESLAKLAGEVRTAFNKKFFHPETNRYDRNSQTGNAMPLMLGLAPDDRRAAVLDNLVQLLRTNGNRVNAGDIGFMYLVHALSDAGHGNVLYDMVCQEDGPGYMHQLQKGATSLTETWDAFPGWSQNHCMLGHAEEWFYRGLGGIVPDPSAPGFKRFAVKPQVVGNLAGATVNYDSVFGRITSDWKREGKTFVLKVAVPPNTTAVVHVPAVDPDAVQESNRPAAQADGVRFLRTEGDSAVFEVGSGEYRFTSRMKN